MRKLGRHGAEAHGTARIAAAGGAPGTNWSDDTLNTTKVDYLFSAFDKMIAYGKAHPRVDMDQIAMDAGRRRRIMPGGSTPIRRCARCSPRRDES